MELDLKMQAIFLGQVVLACVLGGLIGLERELARKPAGLRTHMLVAGASALFVVTAIACTTMFREWFGGEMLRADPVRAIQAIAVGVSFIGAGVIIQVEARARVKNLTTAASILFTAAIGVAVASHQYLLATGATLLAFLINRSVQMFEVKYIEPHGGKVHGEEP